MQLHHPTGIVSGAAPGLPTSKSLSARAMLIRALAEPGSVVLRGLSQSGDTVHLAAALAALAQGQKDIHVGEGGTTLRFLLAYCSVRGYRVRLGGSEALNGRPLHLLVEALRSLGARLSYLEREGCAPVEVEGFEQAGASVSLSGAVSSQFLTALLLVAPVLPLGIELSIKKPIVSGSYLEMTLGLMSHFGIAYQSHDAPDSRLITVPPQSYQSGDYTIPADWSSASYWYSVAALAEQADVWLPGLSANDLQGDRAMADFGREFGVQTSPHQGGIRLQKASDQRPAFFQADCSQTPDLAQTLAFLCAGLRVPFRLEGLSTLAGKETDRIAALVAELTRIGAAPKATHSSLEVISYYDLAAQQWRFESYGDHRMALAAAPLSLLRPIEIISPEVVGKSYPGFWQDMQGLGFRLEPFPSDAGF